MGLDGFEARCPSQEAATVLPGGQYIRWVAVASASRVELAQRNIRACRLARRRRLHFRA